MRNTNSPFITIGKIAGVITLSKSLADSMGLVKGANYHIMFTGRNGDYYLCLFDRKRPGARQVQYQGSIPRFSNADMWHSIRKLLPKLDSFKDSINLPVHPIPTNIGNKLWGYRIDLKVGNSAPAPDTTKKPVILTPYRVAAMKRKLAKFNAENFPGRVKTQEIIEVEEQLKAINA